MYSVNIPVDSFAADFDMTVCHKGKNSFSVSRSDINRPGLQLAGYFEHFAANRVQLIGNAEMYYMLELDPAVFEARAAQYASYALPCVIFARGHQPPPILLAKLREKNIPVFLIDKTTTKASHDLTAYLDRALSPTIIRHGVLLDVYGVGVLLTGESGMGKSETALEMLKRGHQLVADDVVEIRRLEANRLYGTAPALTQYLMEIRGIGLIDVRYIYGVGAVMKEAAIDLVIEMEMWQEGKAYDRLGIDETYVDILGVNVPSILLPVRPGRNLAVVLEVASRNFRLKTLGYHAAAEFDKRWTEQADTLF